MKYDILIFFRWLLVLIFFWYSYFLILQRFGHGL